MPKTVTLRLSDETYITFLEAAKAENRSLSNLIETAALAKVREEQFADDIEVAEIMANEELMKRIKKGSQEARLRKGSFVD
jgi:predicted CopG family antitoxin